MAINVENIIRITRLKYTWILKYKDKKLWMHYRIIREDLQMQLIIKWYAISLNTVGIISKMCNNKLLITYLINLSSLEYNNEK